MSNHIPWTPEDAEKWAREWTEATFKKNPAIHADDAYMAGMAKAAEIIKEKERSEISRRHDDPLTEAFREVIFKWKHSWMDVKGTDERDRKNYFSRAFGIDANMSWDLAQRLTKMIEACETIRYTLRDGKPHTGSYEVYEAHLVGVREIEKGEA